MLAAADTEGRPGLGWRARRAAKDTERMVNTAQREAKLAGSLAQANRSYEVYDRRPLSEPDEWGDLDSFHRAAKAS
jgi:hypothetical protein